MYPALSPRYAEGLFLFGFPEQINREHDKAQRENNDDRADGVDLRRDTAPQGRIDVHGQGVVAPGKEEGDGYFVERHGERQQSATDDGRAYVGQRHQEKRLPWPRAEIAGGFLDTAVESLQAGEDLGH